ncbi:uncharacterized protein LOC127253819 [Andrographis paniculata]|uniref:uncharacterized protein LOC127253819 n=1 Tax=Andrographis paniculata TaxID=175694 RepID=UPI0021E88867|nr:uncharacterized protein LOC127253819 [Andrographis paniculata]
MSSQAEDPTRRQTLPPAPRSGRARHPTRRQSLPELPIEPTPSPIASAAGVSSDSEGTTSQMGRPPYMASDSSISKEEPAALAEADPQDDIPAAADPEIIQSDAAALETESATAAAIPIALEIPAAVAIDAAAQPAAAQPAAVLPPAIEWQAEEPPVAAQPPEIEEVSSSDSETSVNLVRLNQFMPQCFFRKTLTVFYTTFHRDPGRHLSDHSQQPTSRLLLYQLSALLDRPHCCPLH